MNSCKNKTNWRSLITEELLRNSESWDKVIAHTLTDNELDKNFCDTYGLAEGPAFTLWTENRVYFPVQYDGAEWCDSVPRNPCDIKTHHLGGG